MFDSRRRLAVWIVLGVLGATAFASQVLWAAEAGVSRIYVTVNKSRVLNLGQRVTQVSVANPSIADVTVITPEKMLLSGKDVGTTSLTVFHGASVAHFDIIVHPAPVVDADVEGAGEPHSVLVHRAEKVTNQTFVRDKDEAWVELGSVKPATEAQK